MVRGGQRKAEAHKDCFIVVLFFFKYHIEKSWPLEYIHIWFTKYFVICLAPTPAASGPPVSVPGTALSSLVSAKLSHVLPWLSALAFLPSLLHPLLWGKCVPQNSHVDVLTSESDRFGGKVLCL